eukprot:1158756-Pelagomonas_calceolata.AAC.14
MEFLVNKAKKEAEAKKAAGAPTKGGAALGLSSMAQARLSAAHAYLSAAYVCLDAAFYRCVLMQHPRAFMQQWCVSVQLLRAFMQHWCIAMQHSRAFMQHWCVSVQHTHISVQHTIVSGQHIYVSVQHRYVSVQHKFVFMELSRRRLRRNRLSRLKWNASLLALWDASALRVRCTPQGLEAALCGRPHRTLDQVASLVASQIWSIELPLTRKNDSRRA